MKDVLIIGAGTAGLTAAIYAARAGLDAVTLERENYGGQIINTPDIENYPGLSHVSGFQFATDLYEQAKALGAQIVFDDITKLSGSFEEGFTASCEYGEDITARTVVIATGAKSRPLGAASEEKFKGRGVSYCATCDGAFYKGKTVAVAGGGNTAVEDALYLAGLCAKVYLIHRRDGFRADKKSVEKLLALPNVEPLLFYTVKDLQGEKTLSGAVLQSTKGEADLHIDIDGLFVAIGQIPATSFLGDFVQKDEYGYIAAGEDCATSVKGVYIAGDARTKAVRQLTTAASDGCIAISQIRLLVD